MSVSRRMLVGIAAIVGGAGLAHKSTKAAGIKDTDGNSDLGCIAVRGAAPVVLHAVIDEKGTESTPVTANGRMLTGIDLDENMTVSTLSLLHSVDGSVFREVRGFSMAIDGGGFLPLDPPICGLLYLKVKIDKTESSRRNIALVFLP